MFEPAWDSVRPAPTVTIDFGNGHAIKRTLQGNIATYVCGSEGIVYDVLPGIYDPTVYRRELEACKVLAESLRPRPAANQADAGVRATEAKDTIAARLREYHAKQAARLSVTKPPPRMRAIAQTGGGF